MNIINRIKTKLVAVIEARIEAELENIMNVCIEAGAEIQAAIDEALKF